MSYFSDPNFSHKTLHFSNIQTYVVNRHFLILFFQPYIVGNYVDGPFVVKVPIEFLISKCMNSHLFYKIFCNVIASKNFVSSWDAEDLRETIELLDNTDTLD